LPDGLVAWRKAIGTGNRAFEGGRYQDAIRHYTKALAIAHALFGQFEDAEAGVAAWVIAHHNLADTCERLGRCAEQRQHLCDAHRKLCLAMDDASLPASWQEAALRHSRRTYGELTRFLSQYPDDQMAIDACRQGAAGPSSGQPMQ
jgi:tetratricopeptide (TPR) repeat protein